MPKKEDKWEPCPRCGSNKVENRGGCFFFMVGFVLIGISLWLLIIPPIGITGIVVGILIILGSFFMKDNLQCQDCKKSWKYPYDEGEIKEKSN